MTQPLAPGSVIGILGGGQLGRMLANAGAQLGFDIHIFDPEDHRSRRWTEVALQIRARQVEAFDDFVQSVDIAAFRPSSDISRSASSAFTKPSSL